MLRRFVWFLVSLLGLCLGGTAVAVQGPDHIPYNCISNEGIHVQLNRHLEFGAPYLHGELASPDGNAVLQLWNIGESYLIRLWYPASGESKVLQRGVTESQTRWWKWSPDSRFVYYIWKGSEKDFSNGIATQDGTRSSVLALPVTYSVLSVVQFSPGGDYLWLYDYGTNTLSVVATRTFQQDVVWSRGTGGGSNVAVATSTRSGDRLAFNIGSGLLVADPVSRRIDWVTFIEGFRIDYLFVLSNSLSIEWSPDGRYLAIMYRFDGVEKYLDVFAVEDLTPVLVEKIVIPDVPDEFPRQFAQWSDADHTLLFFQPSGQGEGTTTQQFYDLREYDPETRENRLIRGNILQFSAGDNVMLTVRRDADHIVEELCPIIGTGSTILGMYPANEIDQRECYLQDGLLSCRFPGVPWRVWFLDGHGGVNWAWTAPAEPEERAGKPFAKYSDNGRFAAVIWQHNEETWIDLADLMSGRTFHLPVTIDGVTPLSQNDSVPEYRWTLDYFPSPAEDTWLILASGEERTRALYRFVPARNAWSLFFHDRDFRNPISNLAWSPDSRLVAFTNKIRGDPSPSLFVMDADGSRQWNLGYFPHYGYLSWERCSGLGALLRGGQP